MVLYSLLSVEGTLGVHEDKSTDNPIRIVPGPMSAILESVATEPRASDVIRSHIQSGSLVNLSNHKMHSFSEEHRLTIQAATVRYSALGGCLTLHLFRL